MTNELLSHLRELEQRLHDPVVRRDPDQAAALLADDFREFGASGRTYDKAAILALLASEPRSERSPTTADYHGTTLGPTAALLTYTAARSGLATLRSSLWVVRKDRWQLLFHQGTPAPAAGRE